MTKRETARRQGGLTKRASPLPPAMVTASLASLEQLIGGRDVLVAALSHAPKSKDVEYVLGLLGDPANARTPLSVLCASGGITAGELIESFKSGELNRAQALSTREIGKALQGVVADTMRLAAPYEDTCYACQGLGQVTPDPTRDQPNPQPEPCETCKASGRLVYKGDIEHKKLALDLAHMSSKSGGVNVQVNQQNNQFNLGAAGGALEQLQAATDRILYGGEGQASQTLDAEVIDEPPEPEPPDEPEATLDTDWRGDLSRMSLPLEQINERLDQLPKFYSWRDVLDGVFESDEDAFVDAWCDGTLPLYVRQAVNETMPSQQAELMLMRRQVRLLNSLLVRVQASLEPS